MVFRTAPLGSPRIRSRRNPVCNHCGCILMIWLIVFLSFLAGYTLTNALWFLDAILKAPNTPAPDYSNLPEDEHKWRKLLEKEQKY